MNITHNVQKILTDLPECNPYGEKVTLVAAVKTRTPAEINEAIRAGIADIGDNRVQEFTQKYSQIEGNPRRHFIGRLQTNKIKYLLGKIDLYHSIDRMNLAEELNAQSGKRGIVSNILLEINIGGESTKGGFSEEQTEQTFKAAAALENLKIRGLMTVLPECDDMQYLSSLARKMRYYFEKLRDKSDDVDFLSMGMSGDYMLCIEQGSNMIRLGTAIFGPRI